MIKLEKISIANFKNIDFADLNLRELNVLVGPNGSGKTNLLMVTAFLNHIIGGTSEAVTKLFKVGYDLRFGDILPLPFYNKKEGISNIRLEFVDTEINNIYYYSIEFHKVPNDSPSREFVIGKEFFSFKNKSKKGTPTTIFSRDGSKIRFNNDLKKLFPIDKLQGTVSMIRILDVVVKATKIDDKYNKALNALNSVLRTNTFYLSSHALKYNDYEPSTYFEGRMVNFDLGKEIINFETSKEWSLFKQALKSVLDIEDISIDKYTSEQGVERKYISFIHLNKRLLIHEMSDGMILLVALIFKIFTSNNCIIFLEEIENSIHPKALSNLLDFIRSSSSSKQFLISTHSTTLINLIKPEEVFVAHVNSNGMSHISNVKNVKELKAKLSKGFISFGDLLYQNIEEEEFEDIF